MNASRHEARIKSDYHNKHKYKIVLIRLQWLLQRNHVIAVTEIGRW